MLYLEMAFIKIYILIYFLITDTCNEDKSEPCAIANNISLSKYKTIIYKYTYIRLSYFINISIILFYNFSKL